MRAKDIKQKALSSTSRPDQVEEYTPERIAEFLLNNAVDATSYDLACAEVRALGLDPESIPHVKPQD